MRVHVQGKNLNVTAAVRRHVIRKAMPLLERLEHGVARFRIEDVNGPRGGIDKRCQILLELPRKITVIIAATGRQIFEAIDAAIEKLPRWLERQASRRRVRRLGRAEG